MLSTHEQSTRLPTHNRVKRKKEKENIYSPKYILLEIPFNFIDSVSCSQYSFIFGCNEAVQHNYNFPGIRQTTTVVYIIHLSIVIIVTVPVAMCIKCTYDVWQRLKHFNVCNCTPPDKRGDDANEQRRRLQPNQTSFCKTWNQNRLSTFTFFKQKAKERKIKHKEIVWR